MKYSTPEQAAKAAKKEAAGKVEETITLAKQKIVTKKDRGLKDGIDSSKQNINGQ